MHYALKYKSMKKLNFLLMAAAGLALASCSQDELNPSFSNGGGNVHFTVSLPSNSVSSRAIGDGFAATNLSVLVYDVDDSATTPTYTYVMDGNQTFPDDNLSTTVDLDLVTGKSYKIVFFAYSPQAMGTDPVYSIDSESGVLTVNYAKMNSTDNLADDYGCFYGTYTTGPVGNNAGINANVTLTRPVAQINWGTTGFGSESISNVSTVFGENGEYIVTSLAVSAYTTLDMLNDTYGGQENVDLLDFATPNTLSTVPTFPGNNGTNTYNYMAMQYVLAPSETSATYDLVLTVQNNGDGNASGDYSNEITVSNAPVQANYQTNIYGSLLSSHATFTVTKSAAWGENSPYEIEVGVKEPATDPENEDTYLITSQAELNWIAQQSNEGKNTFSGKTIQIEDDIYMTGEWTPISVGSYFNGTIDGQNHTIYNMTVNTLEYGGFVGQMYGTIKDLNFDNANVNTTHFGGVVAAYNSNNNPNNAIINCSVSNSSVVLDPTVKDTAGEYNGDKGGIIIGFMQSGIYMQDCTVTNCTLSGYRDLGGLTGLTTGNKFTNCKINGLTITINNSNNYKGYTERSAYDVNNYYGEVLSQPTLDGCSADNVTITLEADAATQTALQSAVSTPGTTINLSAGSYSLPTGVAEGVTIKGTPDAVFTINSSMPANYNGVTFDGVKFVQGTPPQSGFPGIQHSSNLTYNNCEFEGLFYNFSIGLTFNNCTFNQTGNNYSICTYGANDILFDGCKFNCDGKAIYLYSQTSTTKTVSFKDCTFTAKTNVSDKSAIMINGGDTPTMSPFIVSIDNCTATGFTVSEISGNDLWGIKDNNKAILTTVTVNGDEVYNTIQ